MLGTSVPSSSLGVYLGKNLKVIHPGAFEGCSKLERIEIPETVQYIYHKAFAGCDKLRVLLKNPDVSVSEGAFPKGVVFE